VAPLCQTERTRFPISPFQLEGVNRCDYCRDLVVCQLGEDGQAQTPGCSLLGYGQSTRLHRQVGVARLLMETLRINEIRPDIALRQVRA